VIVLVLGSSSPWVVAQRSVRHRAHEAPDAEHGHDRVNAMRILLVGALGLNLVTGYTG
jgi:hypothetical protein